MFHHLQAYLLEVKTVIIPDLGAITITNPDTGETMFMSFLKHDDGKFAAYVADKEGKNVDAVKQELSSAVSEIQSRLNAEGKAEIGGFGQFILQDGEIDFVPAGEGEMAENASPPLEAPEEIAPVIEEVPSSVDLPPSAPLEVPVEEPPAEPEETAGNETEEPAPETEPEAEPEKESAPVPTEELPPASETEETSSSEAEMTAPEVIEVPESPVEEVVNEVNEQVQEPAAPEVKLETATPILPPQAEKSEPAPEMNILQREQLAASQKKLDDLRKAKEAKPARKKRGAGFWMLIALIALLAVGGTFVGIYYDEVKKHVPFLADSEEENADEGELEEMEELLDDGSETEADAEEDSDGEVNNDEAQEVEETPAVEENEKVPEKTTPPSSTSSEMRWHLIAGTFSVEANAQRLADNLRNQGFSPTIRQVGAMYLVSAKGFATKEAAIAGKAELGSAAAKSWLYEWK